MAAVLAVRVEKKIVLPRPGNARTKLDGVVRVTLLEFRPIVVYKAMFSTDKNGIAFIPVFCY